MEGRRGFLGAVPAEDLRSVRAAMRRRTFAKGEVIFHEGDPAETSLARDCTDITSAMFVLDSPADGLAIARPGRFPYCRTMGVGAGCSVRGGAFRGGAADGNAVANMSSVGGLMSTGETDFGTPTTEVTSQTVGDATSYDQRNPGHGFVGDPLPSRRHGDLLYAGID
ncbi:MAG: cyclic nucleotide-binding domain-containing protein [Acidimicrobiales bacterium]|nr:cyclic nucleotide-binding domain-containing protein [Acidimicrobiales bacterium]